MRSRISDLEKVYNCRKVGMNVKRNLYKGVTMSSALYGAKTWSMEVSKRKVLNIMEMKCLRSICGVTLMD